MKLSYCERKVLENLATGRDPREGLSPMSRAGVIGSISKKGLAEWQRRRVGRYLTDEVLRITLKGRRALARPAPQGLEADYKSRHGLRKFFGLNPVNRKTRDN
jgi:hypothetical protein